MLVLRIESWIGATWKVKEARGRLAPTYMLLPDTLPTTPAATDARLHIARQAISARLRISFKFQEQGLNGLGCQRVSSLRQATTA